MQVLKKFGLLSFLLLLLGSVSYAQSQDNCNINSQEVKIKKDPIDFIHNHLLKSSPSNPVTETKTKYSTKEKSSSKSSQEKDKKEALAIKLVNERAKKSIASSKNNSNKAIQTDADKFAALNNSDKKVVVTTTTTVSNDLTVSRTVIKNLPSTPPKEETSFSTSVMDWVKDKYSCMINVLPNQISNVMLYRFIDEWYGVKYRMGGTSKKGVDCSAFVQTLYKYVFGLDLLRTACLQFNSSEIIKNPADLKEGDLVFFRVGTSRISHVGVYLRNNFFVHSASSKGVSIANLTNVYWSKYFAGGGRVLQKS